MPDQSPAPSLDRYWRLRYWLARRLILVALRVMPSSWYRSELKAALWVLWFKVAANCAAADVRNER